MRINLLLTLLTLFFGIFGQIYSQSITQKIDQVMQKYVELDQFSGTVLLAKDGNILYSKAFGDANKSYDVKNTLDTKFNIASIGKMFTGISILQLEEQGRLNLHDPVVKHLNNFPFGEHITIFHLLSHTSGVGSYMRHKSYRSNRNGYKIINQIVPLIYEQKLEFKTPGEKFSYSNSGLVLLGAIIEKVTELTYKTYISKHILEPSGMKNTHMKYLDDVVPNRATGYIKSSSGKFRNNYFFSSSPFSDGGILSTVTDLLKFDQALYSDHLISNESKAKMFTTIIPKVTYGLTFQVEERHGNKIVGHSGGMPGFSSYFSRYLKDKYTVIALSNYDMISKNVVHYIENILYGKKYELPKERLGPFIYKNSEKIKELSLNELSGFIHQSYKIRSPRYLNMIAYDFKRENFKTLAIKLFKLNVHLFPNEANVYDSLGEALEANKQYKLALKNYKMAVKIATKNSDMSLNSFTMTLERFKKEHSL